VLSLALAGLTACNPFGESEPEVTEELVDVVRGDLAVIVSGSGNTEIIEEIRLAFSSGKIEKLYVEENETVDKGDIIAKLETDALELAISQTTLAVSQAELAVELAKYNLKQAQELYTWPEIKIAQENVDDAKAYLDYVGDSLELASTEVEQLRWTSALVYAQARLASAEAILDAMIHSYDTDEVAIKKVQVAVAEQSLEVAKETLEQAQRQLDKATLYAPFAGTVASVYVDEGDTVLATTPIIYLIDLSSMELEAGIDEIDIAGVKPGQRVIIEVDGLPDSLLEGKVKSISLLPTTEGGVILYDVQITIDDIESSGLKAGMSATADIIINESNDVLLVPDRAIGQDEDGNSVVEIMVDGVIETRIVTTGISDGFLTEITEGLTEGEQVIEKRATPKPSSSGFF